MFSSNAAVKPALQHDIDKLHEEALEMNGLFNSAAFRFHHFWGSLDYAARSEAVEKAHAEALAMEEAHQMAIATIADNLTLPVWERCSPTIKREVVEHHHAEALEMNAQYDLGVAMAADHNAQLVFSRQSDAAKYGLIELAHLEALLLNRLMDLPIADPGRLLAYILWRNKANAAGCQLVKFACPHCETDFHALAPEIGEASDAFCTCPVCDNIFFRIVDNENGKPVVSVHAVKNSAEGVCHA